MSAFQIIIYSFIALIIFFWIRKSLNKRRIKHYTANEIYSRLKNGRDLILLDVRTDHERKSGFIKGSIHIPLNQLNRSFEDIRKFKDKEIICYCRSGNRSLSAAILLQKKGINAANLIGGITAWKFQKQK